MQPWHFAARSAPRAGVRTRHPAPETGHPTASTLFLGSDVHRLDGGREGIGRQFGGSVSNHFPIRAPGYGNEVPRLIIHLGDAIQYASAVGVAFVHLAVWIPGGTWLFELVPYNRKTFLKLSGRVPEQNRAINVAVTI